MRKTALVLFLIILLSCISAFGDDQRTVTVTDMAGREVTVPFDPDRIICLGPGTLRLIVYLQSQGKVVGVEDMEKRAPRGRPYWIAHPELAELPRCGPGGPAAINKKPDLEAVLSTRPQVIFVIQMDASLADEVERTLEIPVVVLSYGTFAGFNEEIYDALRIAGKVLDREQRASKIIEYFESSRKDLEKRTSEPGNSGKPLVYVGGIGYRGSQGIGSTEQKFIPFEWTNADNAAKKVKATIGTHVFLDKETLLTLDPDIIFIDGGGLSLVREDYRKKPEYYKSLSAFANRRVYSLPPFNFYSTNLGTALANAYAIGKILHPERFEDLDPEIKADEIYLFLVGKPVYQKMKEDFGAIGQPVNLADWASRSQ